MMKDIGKKTNYHLRGDIHDFFASLPMINNSKEQLQVFQDINHLFKKNVLTTLPAERSSKNTLDPL